MEELNTIEALSVETFKFTTKDRNVYTAKPVDIEIEDGNPVFVFDTFDSNGRQSCFKYDPNIDARLEEALKKISLSTEDIIAYIINCVLERRYKVSLVRKLREDTGCGMLTCKKALVTTDWVYDKAKEYIEHPERTYVMFES